MFRMRKTRIRYEETERIKNQKQLEGRLLLDSLARRLQKEINSLTSMCHEGRTPDLVAETLANNMLNNFLPKKLNH